MRKLSFAWLTIGLALFAGACEPEIPFAPSYAQHVRPLFMAHCVRCHGAGDMLLSEVLLHPGTAEPKLNPSTGMPMRSAAPILCYLDRFESVGAGCPTPGQCQFGAEDCVSLGLLAARFPPNQGDVPKTLIMPPPPSELLNEWEYEVLRRWIALPLP